MTDQITFRDLLRLMARGFVFKFGNSPEAEQVEDALRRAADTIDGLRDRVIQAEARLAEVEMYAGSDREERQYWESRYVEVRDQLVLADAVVEAVEPLTIEAETEEQMAKFKRSLAAYRAAKETT